jgi:molybdenum cofactor cytidylyltransferase
VSVAAVVLAAGFSRRFGTANKLLSAGRDGVPMIVRTVRHVLASRAQPVIVVTGHEAERVEACLPPGARPVRAPDHAKGMSASLRAGLRALPAGVAASLVCLGDMPLVGAALLDAMIARWEADPGAAAVVPVCGGRRGNPVLWPAAAFPALCALAGDGGGRRLLEAAWARVAVLETQDEAVLRDIDTRDALEAG